MDDIDLKNPRFALSRWAAFSRRSWEEVRLDRACYLRANTTARARRNY
jgi:hypothetical protein